MNDEVYVLSTVTNGDQRSRTRSRVHGGLGRRRESKVVARRGEDDYDSTSGDVRLERCARHQRGKDHDHHRFRSSISHAQGHAPERAQERRTREKVQPSAYGSKIPDTGGKKITFQGEERVHALVKATSRTQHLGGRRPCAWIAEST